MFLHEAIPTWAVFFFTKQEGQLPRNMDTKGCISCITVLILDSPRSSLCSYQLIRSFFSSVMFFAFNQNLSLSVREDSDGSCFRVLVPTAIIPIL